jgi:Arc/MetJ family transcription regulator
MAACVFCPNVLRSDAGFAAMLRLCMHGWIIVSMKTTIDLDDAALALAARELGTTTKKDTVNAALDFVAGRRRRIELLLDDPDSIGVGSDITDPAIMRQARR